MSEYTATAVCEGDNCVIDVPGIGTTHADTVGDIEEMAVDLVTARPRWPDRRCTFRCDGRMGPGNPCAGVQR
jgi:hypothetical protein